MWPAHLPNKSKEKCACSSAMVSSGYSKGKFLINCVAPFFLLQKQHIPDICHKYHKLDMWRKICHVEKFQIYMHDRCGEIWNFSTCRVISNFCTWQMWRNLTFLHMLSNFKFLHMADVEEFEVSPHLACVWCGECLFIYTCYAVLLKKLFCHDLRRFVAKSFLSGLTHFCVEKYWTKTFF